MAHLEIGMVDRYLLAVDGTVGLEPWLQEGFKLLGRYERLGAFAEAMHAATLRELEPIWREIVGGPMPDNVPRRVIDDRLEEETDGDEPRLLILTRMIVRNSIIEPIVYEPRAPVGPQRLSTEHYVVIETVDENGDAVPSIRCELVIAGGEVRTVSTGPKGVVRVDRVQAARVTIRVVDLDGWLWWPLEGAASQPSGAQTGVRWHEARQGDCLSRIAHHYGIKGWQALWDHPKNEPLRKKRKSPHVLLPGDQVAVPAVNVHEIVRATDATHRLVLADSAEVTLDVVLEGSQGEPLQGQTFIVRYGAGKGAVELKAQTLGADGKLTMSLPTVVRQVEVELPDLGEILTLRLGELDPVVDAASHVPEITGVQQRLDALGYGGALTGKLDDATTIALADFQRRELGRVNASGELDAETCSKLDEVYQA